MELNEQFFKMGYYEDFKGFSNRLVYFDKGGIPMIRFYATDEIVYNPTTVAVFALEKLQLYLSGQQRALEKFETGIRWLSQNGLRVEDSFILPLNFEHPIYGLRQGWISALTQGLAISCFIRKYILTGDVYFLKLAIQASKPLMRDIKHGGVAYYDENGELWLEEAPSTPPSHILNGFIYAIWGLYDLYYIQRDVIVKDHIVKAISTLERNIYKYDLGYWSKYQLNPELPADFQYHTLHIKQLQFLYYMSKKQIFNKYAQKFANQSRDYSKYLKAQLVNAYLYSDYLIETMGLQSIKYIVSRGFHMFRDKFFDKI